MAKSAQKVTLSPSRDIPFDKLVLSQSNVRRIKAGISVEELAEDIARRGLLQSLSVRPVLADDGSETGKWRCCTTLTVEDSQRESMRLDGLHEQAIPRPLPHDKLVQLHCLALQARFAVDLAGQGHDLALAA